MLPPVEGAAEPIDRGIDPHSLHPPPPQPQSDSSLLVLVPVLNPSPNDALAEIPYVTVLSCWDGEEADSESSNEEEDTGVSPASFGDDGPMGEDSPSDTATHTHKYVNCVQYCDNYYDRKCTAAADSALMLQGPDQSSRSHHPQEASSTSSSPIREAWKTCETEDPKVRS